MKKKLLVGSLTLFAALFAPQLLFAQSASTCVPGKFCALAPIPGLTSGSAVTNIVNHAGFAAFFNELYKYLVGLAAVLAIIMIIWSGINITLHRDSVSTEISSKGRITNAIFGLILVLSPVLVFSIINPSILNLSLSIPSLDLSRFWNACYTDASKTKVGAWDPTNHKCDSSKTPKDGVPCADSSGNIIPNTYWSKKSSSCVTKNTGPVTACQTSSGAWGVSVTDTMGGSTCDTNQTPPDGATCYVFSGSGMLTTSQTGTYDQKSKTCVVGSAPVTACQASPGVWGVWVTGTIGGTCDTSQTPPQGATCTVLSGSAQESGTYDQKSKTCVVANSSSGSGSSGNTTTSNL